MGNIKIWVRLRLEDLRAAVRKGARRWIRKLFEIVISDLDLMNSIRDLHSSIEFEHEHLAAAVDFKDRIPLHRWALSQLRDDTGLFLEFGVYKGDSINRFAELNPNVTFHGFDTFSGLPETWNLGAKAGAIDAGGRPPVRGNVRLIEGLFADTLPKFLAEHPEKKISFMHIDCDIYSSTKTVFDHAKKYLGPGAIIIFDEYFNYFGWQEQEHKAFMQYVKEENVAFDYIAYVRNSRQVAVRLR
jgi:hypothetical protein